MKKLKKLIFSRVFVVGVLILMQLLMILSMTIEFTKYFIVYYAVMFVLAFVFVLKIINTNQNMAYKLAWIVVVFIFPAFGVALYIVRLKKCGSWKASARRYSAKVKMS